MEGRALADVILELRAVLVELGALEGETLLEAARRVVRERDEAVRGRARAHEAWLQMVEARGE